MSWNLQNCKVAENVKQRYIIVTSREQSQFRCLIASGRQGNFACSSPSDDDNLRVDQGIETITHLLELSASTAQNRDLALSANARTQEFASCICNRNPHSLTICTDYTKWSGGKWRTYVQRTLHWIAHLGEKLSMLIPLAWRDQA